MLLSDTLNCAAIPKQVSFGPTVYSKGGKGVSVGTGVLVRAMVGVNVNVGVGVMVAVGPFAGAAGRRSPAARNATNTSTALMAISNTIKPSAVGRLRVISGIRPAETPAFFLGSTMGVNSVPHTRQRAAFSASRVPHVGQILVVGLDVSGLIRTGIIPFPL